MWAGRGSLVAKPQAGAFREVDRRLRLDHNTAGRGRGSKSLQATAGEAYKHDEIPGVVPWLSVVAGMVPTQREPVVVDLVGPVSWVRKAGVRGAGGHTSTRTRQGMPLHNGDSEQGGGTELTVASS